MTTETVPPAPPDDLRARCRATIPVLEDPRRVIAVARRRRFGLRIGLAAAAFGVGGFVLTEYRAHVQNPVASPAAEVAFANELRLMPKFMFFHIVTKRLSFDSSAGNEHETVRMDNEWTTDETWFDAEKGSRTTSARVDHHASTRAKNAVTDLLGRWFGKDAGEAYPAPWSRDFLYLPDGSRSIRIENRVKTTQFDKGDWARDSELSSFTASGSYGMGYDGTKKACLYHNIGGSWKGRRANLFFFDAPVSPIDAVHGAPILRTIYYFDAETHRLIAKTKFTRWAYQWDRGEVLATESEYDYERRPDPAKFDLHSLTAGATTIQHAVFRHSKNGPNFHLAPD